MRSRNASAHAAGCCPGLVSCKPDAGRLSDNVIMLLLSLHACYQRMTATYVNERDKLTMRSKGIVPHFCCRSAVLLFHCFSCFLRAPPSTRGHQCRCDRAGGEGASPQAVRLLREFPLHSATAHWHLVQSKPRVSGEAVHDRHSGCSNTIRR